MMRIDSVIKGLSKEGQRALLDELCDGDDDVRERYGLTTQDAARIFAKLMDDNA